MSNNLAIQKHGDGWAQAAARTARRILRGTQLKHVDGRGTVDGQPWDENREVIVTDVAEIVQCFLHGAHVESRFLSPDEPVDLDKLNSDIPVKDWDLGLDKQPRPPWQIAVAVYLLDENTGEEFTLINSTWGMRRAFDDLVRQVDNIRKLRGGVPIVPVVTVSSTVMKTQWGQKMRPWFRIQGWKGPTENQALLKPVPKLTATELTVDSIPDHSAPKAAKASPKAKANENWQAPWDDDIGDLGPNAA